MSETKVTTGFILKTDLNGKIRQVKQNDLCVLHEGDSLMQIVDPASLGKLFSFLMTLKNEGSALGWEVNFKTGSKFQSVYLAGLRDENILTLIATTDVVETRKYFNDLMVISNQQQNQLREAVKESVNSQSTLKKSESSFNQLTELNNEMTNLQRELAKKNNTLNELNKTLEEKNRELDQFAYIVSHDLKAPLRGIASVISMIEEDYEEEFDDDLKDMFGMITTRAYRMDDLINSILTYSRAGKVETKITTFALGELLTEILDAIAAPDSYQFVLPEDLPTLTCSYIQLSQVLTNLMGNAVKYHDKPSGTIRLEINKLENGFFRFAVIDDGPGIPEKYHDRVFNAFETANQESRTDSTGIGLAIVQKLVEQHGGNIGLISTVGKGSEFWFTWPEVVKQNS